MDLGYLGYFFCPLHIWLFGSDILLSKFWTTSNNLRPSFSHFPYSRVKWIDTVDNKRYQVFIFRRTIHCVSKLPHAQHMIVINAPMCTYQGYIWESHTPENDVLGFSFPLVPLDGTDREWSKFLWPWEIFGFKRTLLRHVSFHGYKMFVCFVNFIPWKRVFEVMP